ncbi:MAG: hypothetical protein E7434_05715 [Ruminococcaceae bacterium]|nr:hypothetical protein [Oscillospiraceae bacterium]
MFFRRISDAFRRFMYGRYGTDQLNMALLVTAFVMSLLNSILSAIFRSFAAMSMITLVISLLVYAILIYEVFRTLSRNIYKRRRENQRFLNFWNRIRDRSHCYFRCPQCKQTVRVPKHRGKINIRCPKCGEKFIKKT